MKKFLFVTAALFSAVQFCAQGFNGTIDFKYATGKDTTTNTYFVKDKKVALETYNKKSGNLEGSYLFNLEEGTIKGLNPKRKVWFDHKSETAPIIKGKCEVTKGTNSKTIQGIKCHEYIVKNTEENTHITYWIATEKFNFFMPVVKMWNRKDKQSVYFGQITGLPEGSMPLLSEEKTISDGKSITKLEVVKIGRKVPDDSAMEIPADYNRFDK
jgi:hypothetical protein